MHSGHEGSNAEQNNVPVIGKLTFNKELSSQTINKRINSRVLLAVVSLEESHIGRED